MRLALFGGTFDPIHSGHIQAGLAAASEHSLDRILVIPCGHPPHKPESCGASYEQRYKMVQLACEADSRLEASRLEEPSLGEEPNYTNDAKRVDCAPPASSQEIRHRAKIGGTLADLAPPSVCAFVWEHGLYRHWRGRKGTVLRTTIGA